MAFSPEKQTSDVSAEHESSQDLARKLPEGDALPDGFSEGFTEESEHDNSATNLSKDYSNGPQDVGTSEADSGALETLSDKIPERLKFSSGSPEVSVDSNDGSPCVSPSGLKKVRRFPVQLSDKDSLDHLDEKLGSCTISGAEGATNSEVALNDKGVCVAQGADDGEGRMVTGEQLEFEMMSSGKKEPFSCKTVDLTEPNSSKDTCFESEVKLHATLLEDELMDLRKQNKGLENEKLSATNELAKNLLVRERLESLCRELQRQNKQLTDECKRIASEEQQKRLDLSTRFHDAIKDVTAKLEEQGDERLRHIKENELLQEKLKTFAQQYEFREQQYAQQLRTKTLEQQLLEVKLKQQEELNKQGEAKIELYTEQVAQLLKTEQDLRGRLALYGDKFEQFQDTLTKSNEVFTSFKTQMEKMSKTIKKLEKENFSLKKKCEKSDVSLIELVEERTNLKKQLETTKNQKEKLEALCRSLQAERKQQTLAMAGVAASAAATGAVSVAAVLKSEQEE